jgi:integrase/recombinase XerD
MKALHKAVADYLALRRSLGFKLANEERGLRYFLSFLEQKGATRITTGLALQFATQRRETHPTEYAKRLCTVRGFAAYHRGIDPSTEVPPCGLLPYPPQRARPYFYSENEIRQLLKAARNLQPADSLRPWTYHCLFGLLAATGMRLGEAVNLQLQDVDWVQGLLTIRNTKFGKSRLIPLHASTQKVLAGYAKRRNQLFPGQPADNVFVSNRGSALRLNRIEETFDHLLRQIGLPGSAANPKPRLHDFRHRFAVETLKHWYRTGEDVDRRLPVLSTYLGHVHVTHTYWYLTNTPELMGTAGKRVEKRWRALYDHR